MSIIEKKEIGLDSDLSNFADLEEALECWKRWCGGSHAPTWRAVDMMDIPAQLLPSTIVVDVVERGNDLKFRFWGSAMVDLYGAELTGKLYSDASDTLFGNLPHAQYQQVIETGIPKLYRVTIRRPNNMIAERLNLRLPIVDEHGNVSKVMTIVQIQYHKSDDPEQPAQ